MFIYAYGVLRDGKNGHWRARRGSNPQPLPSEGSTLSIELRALSDSKFILLSEGVSKDSILP